MTITETAFRRDGKHVAITYQTEDGKARTIQLESDKALKLAQKISVLAGLPEDLKKLQVARAQKLTTQLVAKAMSIGVFEENQWPFLAIETDGGLELQVGFPGHHPVRIWEGPAREAKRAHKRQSKRQH